MINFPDAPAINDRFAVGEIAYSWNGQGWVIENNAVHSSGGSIPPASVALFYQAAAPTGWTKLTAHNDKILRVVSGAGGGAGGANAFSTVMAQSAVGNHTQGLLDMASHVHLGLQHAGNSIQAPGGGPMPDIQDNSITGPSGGGGPHSHPIMMNIQYIDIILASKN